MFRRRGYRSARRSGFGKRPINSVKHILMSRVTTAAENNNTITIASTGVTDEVTSTTKTAGTREGLVNVGSTIFSINYEIIVAGAAGATEPFVEVAFVRLPPGATFTIETAEVNAAGTWGLARDLIGRYSGQVLRTHLDSVKTNESM